MARLVDKGPQTAAAGSGAEAGAHLSTREAAARRPVGRLAGFAHRVLQPLTARAAGVALLAMGLAAVLAPLISPHDPLEMHLQSRLAGPSWEFPLGTDETGRDLLSILLHAARISLSVAVSSVAIASLLGILFGLLAGYRRGFVDDLIMRAVDGFLAIPGLLLALTIVGMFGTDLRNLVVALGIIGVPYFIRLMRAVVVVEREKDYVLAARAVGARDWHMMVRTILPNCLSPLIVQVSLSLAFAVLTEASLSFLGLGVQPPEASWGTLLQIGYGYIRVAPWYVISPGLFIFVTVWSLNVLGDALRDALDPRLRRA